MSDRLIIVDAYNVIHRSAHLRPGKDRTLKESRDKLINLLAWTMGGEQARFIVVFDGSEVMGRDESSGRVQVRYSKPPEKADDLIRRLVEDQVDRVDQLTVVTSDIEVARHARAQGAEISLSDLFLASALGPVKDEIPGEEKPATLSKAELQQWAELFSRRKPAADEDEDEPVH